MQDEGEVRGALWRILMGVAELGRPGEVEQVVIEAGAGGNPRMRAVGCGGVGRSGGFRVGDGLAGGEKDKNRETDRVLHGAQDSRWC